MLYSILDPTFTFHSPRIGTLYKTELPRFAACSGKIDLRGTPMPVARSGPVPLRYPVVLGALALLFCFRVAGQAIVYFFGVEFLPPMERWHSGLLPYPLLLAVQIALVVLMVRIVWDFSRGEGYFVGLKPHTGRVLKVLSCVYALAMVARYAVTMVLYPQYRWFTGTLPIWFHFVLAAFLFVVGRFSSDPAAKRVS